MNVSSINSVADARRLFAAEMNSGSEADAAAASKTASTERVKQAEVAAKQFEAIILRQMLSPAVEPLMNGSLGGKGTGGGGGGGVYSYLLTDTLANSISQGGGLGLSKILQQQLMPRGETDTAKAAAVYSQWKGDTS